MRWTCLEELFGAIAVSPVLRLEEFNPQSLVNAAWALATLGLRQAESLGAIAVRALVSVEEFNSQNLANAAGGKGCELPLRPRIVLVPESELYNSGE